MGVFQATIKDGPRGPVGSSVLSLIYFLKERIYGLYEFSVWFRHVWFRLLIPSYGRGLSNQQAIVPV